MSRRAKKRKRKSHPGLSDRQALILSGLFVAALGFGLYANSLGHNFVFDDATLIQQNPSLLNTNLLDLIGPHSYRPVRNLTYAFNYWLGGLDPFGYHLFNVLLHCLNGLMVLAFTYVLTTRVWLALPAAVIFTAHPVQTAAVAYVSGRKDLLAAFFLLAGLLLYLRFRRESREFRWLALAVVAFILACLSKEVALVFPALVLSVELVLAARGDGLESFSRLLARFWPMLLALSLTALVLLLYSVYWVSASRAVGFWGGTAATHYGTSFKLFAHYLKLILWPHPLIADYLGQVLAVSKGFFEPSTLLSMALLLSYVLFTVWCWRRQPLVAFGLTWFGLGILPVLQIIPFHELAADHFLYLPAMGFAVILGQGFELLLTRGGSRIYGALILVVLTGVYSWRTVVRNPDWESSESLWTATYRDAPNSFRANCNLGSFAHNAQEFARAMELTQRCLELQPDDQLPYANLGAMSRDLGLRQLRKKELDQAEKLEMKALEYLETAVELDPENTWSLSNIGDAYRDLGLIYELRGDMETAKALRHRSFEYFQKALSGPTDHPRFPYLYYKTGAIFVDGNDYKSAIPYLKKAADALTGYGQAQYVLGFSYYMVADWENARKYLEAAFKLQPQADIVVYLAESYRQLGGTDQALAILEQGARLFPNSADIQRNLGVLYEEKGQNDRAREHFARALELAPTGDLAPELRRRLGVE